MPPYVESEGSYPTMILWSLSEMRILDLRVSSRLQPPTVTVTVTTPGHNGLTLSRDPHNPHHISSEHGKLKRFGPLKHFSQPQQRFGLLSWCSSMEFFTIQVHYGGKLVGKPTFAYEGGGHTGFNDSEEEDGLFNHGLFDVEVTESHAVEVPNLATVDVPNAAVPDAAPTKSKTTEKKNRNIRKRKGYRKKKRDKKKIVQVNLSCSQKEDKGTRLKGLSDDEYESEYR
ncbi:uncharacterized protein G2W53_014555 [Senna tora]|uniref:Uncharacterized protein n=1 Tax=Senna tora TaxID=362788 RepID=A0A834WTR1_9FABA|nr:uncharacterized protein G2W53_014555 [Senna tora]